MNDEQIWIYPQYARRVAGHHEVRGSRGNERVEVILDRDITPLIGDDEPRAAIKANQSLIQRAAERLFAQDFVSKIPDDRAPQFWHWQIVITRADLEESRAK